MLREQHRFFRSVLVATDTVIVAGAAVAAYFVRFHVLAEAWPPADAEPHYATHAIPVLVAVPLMLMVLLWADLYVPRRDQRFPHEAGDLVKAAAIGLALTVAALTLLSKVLFDGRDFSRLQYLVYGGLALAGLFAWRFTFRAVLRRLRAHGWNLRHVVIIGTGRLGQIVYHTLKRNTWTGIAPSFFLSHHGVTSRRTCLGCPVHGGLSDLERVLDRFDVSGVVIALPGRMSADVPALLARLERYPVDVRIVPDMNPKYMPLNMAVHELDGMPILSVRESPLSGWGRVAKRGLDVVGAVVGLILFAVPMLLIAAAIRLGGPGPVIFRQQRMSLNGQRFRIFKFRTMTHAEDEPWIDDASASGATAAWTKPGDGRVTSFGRILRRTSLDELPQLLNVLLGEMSLVGPRPERPELSHRFRDDWRGYMLRQNVKAGMTGWAQVNGLRGDTSLRKRLQYDLFYIRNWSIGFDLRILWMTVFRGFAHPNAH